MSTDEPDGEDGLTPAQRAEVKKLVANETEESETTRRDALKMGGGLLGLGLLGGGGLAASSGRAKAVDTSAGQLGTTGSSLDLYIDELKDPGGDNLVDVDDTGILDWQRAFAVPALTAGSITDASSGNSYDVDDLASGGGSSGVTVEDDGTTVVTDASAVNMASNLSVTDDGDGTVSVAASGGSGDFVSGDGNQHTIYQQDTAPSSPSTNDIWIDTN